MTLIAESRRRSWSRRQMGIGLGVMVLVAGGCIGSCHCPLLPAIMGQAIRRPLLGIGLALMVPLLGFLIAPTLDQQFFPASDRDQLQIELETLPSTAIKKTAALALAIRDQLLQDEGVKDVHWLVGTNAPRFYYNLTGGGKTSPTTPRP